jgi:hypothetical protein
MSPLRVSSPQTFFLASSYTDAATMVVHYCRQITGEGQQVDIVAQQSILAELTNVILLWESKQTILKMCRILYSRMMERNQTMIVMAVQGWVRYFLHNGRNSLSLDK